MLSIYTQWIPVFKAQMNCQAFIPAFRGRLRRWGTLTVLVPVLATVLCGVPPVWGALAPNTAGSSAHSGSQTGTSAVLPLPASIPAPVTTPNAMSTPVSSSAEPTLSGLEASGLSVAALPLQWSYFIDEAGRFSLDETLFPTQQARFIAYDPWQLPHQNGTMWMRLDLASLTVPSGSWLLDLNTLIVGQIPDTPQVWYVPIGSAAGTLLEPIHPGLYILPSPLPVSGFVYVRTPGVAAPGFMPQLRATSALNEVDASVFESVQWFLCALFMVTLLRGVFERREWRLWASLYTGAVLVQIFWGLPATPRGGLNLWDLPGLLAPGVALLILPHVGRHLLRSRYHSPFIDLQLIILGMPGLMLALAPLVPGYGWTLRYLPFWPLLMLLLVPTVMGALFKNLPGSCRFLCMCLLPPLALLAGLGLAPLAFVTSSGLAVSVVSCLPWLGLGASALFVALVPTPKRLPESAGKETEQAGYSRNGSKKDAYQRAGTLQKSAALSLDTDTLALTSLSPLSITADTTSGTADANAGAPMKFGGESGKGLPMTGTSTEPSRAVPVSRDVVTQNLEADLRELVDALFVNITALDQCRLTDDARKHSDALARTGRGLTKLIQDLPERMGTTLRTIAASGSDRFDLRQLMLEAHNAVSPLAEAKNLALSWFSAPHLHRYYEGDCSMLYNVLILLSTSAVSATNSRGMVQIRAQRVSESNDPGQLVFSVTDTGSGIPPFSRGGMALVRAWELVGASGGTLRMDSGPTGTVVTFSVRFQAVSSAVPLPDMGKVPTISTSGSSQEGDATLGDGLNAPVLRVIVASDVPANRQLMAYYLDELPHEVLEARSAGESVSLYTRTPGALLLLDGDMLEDDMINAIAAVRVFEGEHVYPPTSIVVLVNDEGQSSRLRRAGCTHTLFKPILRTELRYLVLRLMPLPKPRRMVSGTAQEGRKVVGAGKGVVKAGQQAAMSQSTAQPLQLLPDLSLAQQESERVPEKKKWGLLPTFGRNQEKTATLPGKNAEKKTEPAVPVVEAQKLAPEVVPGKADALAFASSKMFSNVGDPTPIVKPKAEAPVAYNKKHKPAPAVFSPKDDWEKDSLASSPSHADDQARDANLTEWVGEPMPITKPVEMAAEWVGDPVPLAHNAVLPPVATRVAFTAPVDTVEWVGEPTPILAPAKERQEETKPVQSVVLPAFSKKGVPASAPVDAVEWVGEPMPIIKPQPQPEPTAPVAAESVEWVGEPMPIVPARQEPSEQVLEMLATEPLPMLELFAVERVEEPVLSEPFIENGETSSVAEVRVRHALPGMSLGFEPDEAGDVAVEQVDEIKNEFTTSGLESLPPETVQEARIVHTSFESPVENPVETHVESTEPAAPEDVETFFGETLSTGYGQSVPVQFLDGEVKPESVVVSLPISALESDPVLVPELKTELESKPASEPSLSSHISRGPNRLYLPGMGLPDLVSPEEAAIITLTERVIDTQPAITPENAFHQESVSEEAFHEPMASATSDFVPVSFTVVSTVAPVSEEASIATVPHAAKPGQLVADLVADAVPESLETVIGSSESSDLLDDTQLSENLARLDAVFEDVQAGIAAENIRAVLAAASALSMVAETLGLHMLAGQARCMEDLADAGDMSAVREFLPELQEAVTRQRASF